MKLCLIFLLFSSYFVFFVEISFCTNSVAVVDNHLNSGLIENVEFRDGSLLFRDKRKARGSKSKVLSASKVNRHRLENNRRRNKDNPKRYSSHTNTHGGQVLMTWNDIKANGTNFTEAQLLNFLFSSLFANYRKEVVPDPPVHVKLDLLLLRVKTAIEKEGIFETVIALLIVRNYKFF